MAQRVNICMTGNITQVGQFTMNNTSIGERQENRRKADVELIQFFLWEFYSRNGRLFSLLPIVSRIPGIVIDGICGQQTKVGIINFQKQQRSIGCPVPVDGVVDVTKDLRTPRNAEIYTIWWLNQWFFNFGTGTEEQKADLMQHPVVRNRAPHLLAELGRMSPRTIP